MGSEMGSEMGSSFNYQRSRKMSNLGRVANVSRLKINLFVDLGLKRRDFMVEVFHAFRTLVEVRDRLAKKVRGYCRSVRSGWL